MYVSIEKFTFLNFILSSTNKTCSIRADFCWNKTASRMQNEALPRIFADVREKDSLRWCG